MTAHNDILLAAAIAGITAGVQDGKDFSQITSASLATTAGATVSAAILAAAQAVDAAIPFDGQLSVSNSSPVLLVTPNFDGSGTAAEILPVFTKYQTLFGICQAAFRGKGDLSSAVVATYAAEAAGIAAQYATTVGQLPTS